MSVRANPSQKPVATFLLRTAGSGLAAVLLAAGCAPSGPQGAVESAGDAPSAAERIALWRARSPAEPLPAAVTFARPVGFREAREFLERNELRPYAVHLRVAGLGGSPRMEAEEASLALLDRAREQALDLVLRTLCESRGVEARLGRGAAGPDPRADVRLLRAMLTRVELSRQSLPELQADSPVIHGLKVVGPIAAVERLGRDPLVARMEPGARIPIRGEERVVVPDPTHPDEPLQPETIPWIEALDAAEARARLEQVTRQRPEECSAWSERQDQIRREGLRQRQPG